MSDIWEAHINVSYYFVMMMININHFTTVAGVIVGTVVGVVIKLAASRATQDGGSCRVLLVNVSNDW